MDTTALPQSKAERAAFANQMFTGLQPAEKKSASPTQQLKPIRSELLAKRKEGFNFKQIAAALKASKLKCEVSSATLRLRLSSPAAQRRTKMKQLAAKRAANLAAANTQSPNAPGNAK